VKTSECIDYYGSKAKLASALGLETPSIYDWKEYPPPLRQIQIEAQTDGLLKAESDCFETKKGRD